MGVFTAHERKVLARFAETAIPAGRVLPAGGEATVQRLEAYVQRMPEWARVGIRSAVWALETVAIPLAGRPFSTLDPAARTRLIQQWHEAPVAALRHALRGLLTVVRAAHFDDPEIYQALGCPYGVPTPVEDRPRWLSQVTDGQDIHHDDSIEVDVVIVGSGAGGAPVGYELALRGHAVLFIEEGRYFRRHEFNGHATEMTQKMYREGGLTIALGNVAVPVWAGRTVGGTTTVNSGTCYRTPERTFRIWREQFGLNMFSSESMDRYFARVESILGVAPAEEKYLGGVARVIARGADALGLVHGPLRRNAPDCDGQGLCCFGCPTGAKRSTDVSYIPMALDRGAALFSNTLVERILVEKGEARGVVARCAGGGTLTVHARMTVLACGALMTPVLLQAHGDLANRSGMVGRNLSIHPAVKVMALFDERIDMHRGIPQGYCIEHFASEGIVFEGASTPLDVTAIALPFSGARFTEVIERYPHLAIFGFMIQDTSRGRVRRGPGGRPLIFYSLNQHDVRKIQRGIDILCQVFLAAGARQIYPSVRGFDVLEGPQDLERLRTRRIRAGDLEVTAYHPLGTARMGIDPTTSVVGPDHQCHDVRNLYIVDGSAVPSSLGVNPQVTIMALATRAAEIMDRRLASVSRSQPVGDPSRTSTSAEGLA